MEGGDEVWVVAAAASAAALVISVGELVISVAVVVGAVASTIAVVVLTVVAVVVVESRWGSVWVCSPMDCGLWRWKM